MKRFLCDIDNVLYPWTLHMAHECTGIIGGDAHSLMASVRNWDVAQDWGMSEGLFNRIWDRSIEMGHMYRFFSPSAEALIALWRLSDAGWHIHLVTARLNRSKLHEKVIENTTGWLREFAVPFRSLSFVEDKSTVYGEVLVDDKPENLLDSPADAKFLFPAGHNLTRRENPDYTALDEDDPWQHLLEVLGV